MKKQGIEYNDIQDHPMIKPMLSKLQNFLWFKKGGCPK
jgi:hypothetical protein